MATPQVKNHENESGISLAERDRCYEENVSSGETARNLKRKRKVKRRISKGLFICVVSLLLVVLLVSVAFNVLQFKYWSDRNSVIANSRDEIAALSRENAEIREKLSKSQTVIAEQENQIQDKDIAIAAYETNIETLNAELKLYEFYKKNAVVISMDDAELYHRYGCSRLDISSGYWIYNVSLAKNKGFSPCKNCLK